MQRIKVKSIMNSEFTVVWVKLMLRNKFQLEDFKFNGVQTNVGGYITITNPLILESLEKDYQAYRKSEISMEEFFQCNIIVAKQMKCENFIIAKRGRLIYSQVLK